MQFLKEKIGELDRAKHQISNLEKQLFEKREECQRFIDEKDKVEEENYELEQSLITEETIIKDQKIKVE